MRNIIADIKHKWANRSVRSRQRLWDNEYAKGFGDLLNLPQEQAHYDALVDFMVSSGKNKNVLDVGCGEGALLDVLANYGYQRYLGVDFSEVALKKAAQRANANTAFIYAPAESFVPDDRFDAIVFNECLYYFNEPLRVFQRYPKYLAPGGVILVSMLRKTDRVKGLDEEISRKFKITRRVCVTNQGGTWACMMIASS